MERRLYYLANLDEADDSYDDDGGGGVRTLCQDPEKANLVSSEIWGSELHAPVLDLDGADPGDVIAAIAELLEMPTVSVTVVPSSTRGHFHLYVNEAIEWDVYVHLLDQLALEGLIEHNYASVSISRGASFVRKRGIVKAPRAPKPEPWWKQAFRKAAQRIAVDA